jgi:putative sterol carrier protein
VSEHEGSNGGPAVHGVDAANGGSVPARAREIVQAMVEVFEIAQEDPSIARRLEHTDTTLVAHFTDAESVSATLMLDRNPVEVLDREYAEAETHVWATTSQWDEFFAGDLHLAMAIAHGDVTYRGPVRKFLVVVPVARRLAGEFRQIRRAQSESMPVSTTGRSGNEEDHR